MEPFRQISIEVLRAFLLCVVKGKVTHDLSLGFAPDAGGSKSVRASSKMACSSARIFCSASESVVLNLQHLKEKRGEVTDSPISLNVFDRNLW